MHATSSSGVMSTSSFHKGFPRALAYRSQTALTIAAVARWSTPFSGPTHRNCDSLVGRREPHVDGVEGDDPRGAHRALAPAGSTPAGSTGIGSPPRRSDA